jgi:energy-converting hydrogenase A subunit R
MMQVRDSIYKDLEGPISPQDNAQLVCVVYVKMGDRLFPVISRYDDLLTLANKEGCEPGDTLALIIAFLVEAGVTEDDIRKVSAEAGLVVGIPEFYAELHGEGCLVWVISTSYEQHALSIAKRAGVPPERVYCTRFPLDQLRAEIGTEDLVLVRQIREKAAQLYREDLEDGGSDTAILQLLNSFYWEELPKTKLGQAITKVMVMGGRRKVRALQEAIRASGGYYLSDAFIVVDSITDWRMAQAVEAAGGLALAWNANWYALPYCSCGIAAVDARDVKPLFKVWRERGRAAVREFVESAPEPKDSESGPYYHWLAGRNESFQREILAIHKRLRTICRGKAVAKLG